MSDHTNTEGLPHRAENPGNHEQRLEVTPKSIFVLILTGRLASLWTSRSRDPVLLLDVGYPIPPGVVFSGVSGDKKLESV